MSYRESIKQWAVVGINGIIKRFKSQSDADGFKDAMESQTGKRFIVRFIPVALIATIIIAEADDADARQRRRRGFRSRQSPIQRPYYRRVSSRIAWNARTPERSQFAKEALASERLTQRRQGFLTAQQADKWRAEFAPGQTRQAVHGKLGEPYRKEIYSDRSERWTYEIDSGSPFQGGRKLNFMFEPDSRKDATYQQIYGRWWLQSSILKFDRMG